jgi:hypothetical protein
VRHTNIKALSNIMIDFIWMSPLPKVILLLVYSKEFRIHNWQAVCENPRDACLFGRGYPRYPARWSLRLCARALAYSADKYLRCIAKTHLYGNTDEHKSCWQKPHPVHFASVLAIAINCKQIETSSRYICSCSL